jgi:hypothetical protein
MLHLITKPQAEVGVAIQSVDCDNEAPAVLFIEKLYHLIAWQAVWRKIGRS